MDEPAPLPCAECGQPFDKKRCTQRFCCSACKIRWHARDWRRRNPERARELDRKSHEPKRAERNAKVRVWHSVHRDEQNAKRRQHHAEHRDQANCKRAQWFRENHEHSLALVRKNYRTAREDTPWRLLVHKAKLRAKARGLPFDLTMEWARQTWTGFCALSGLAFDTTNGTRRGRLFSPSIDQIEPAAGYTQANCRFVLWAVNAFKGTGTDAEVMVIAKAIAERIP